MRYVARCSVVSSIGFFSTGLLEGAESEQIRGPKWSGVVHLCQHAGENRVG